MSHSSPSFAPRLWFSPLNWSCFPCLIPSAYWTAGSLISLSSPEVNEPGEGFQGFHGDRVRRRRLQLRQADLRRRLLQLPVLLLIISPLPGVPEYESSAGHTDVPFLVPGRELLHQLLLLRREGLCLRRRGLFDLHQRQSQGLGDSLPPDLLRRQVGHDGLHQCHFHVEPPDFIPAISAFSFWISAAICWILAIARIWISP